MKNASHLCEKIKQMGQAILKSIKNQETSNKDVVIQITKTQLITFYQLLLLAALVVVNVMAIIKNSPFLQELFLSQSIIAAVFFIKNVNDNQINKKKLNH